MNINAKIKCTTVLQIVSVQLVVAMPFSDIKLPGNSINKIDFGFNFINEPTSVQLGMQNLVQGSEIVTKKLCRPLFCQDLRNSEPFKRLSKLFIGKIL
jgi:hypothetical protein